MPLRLAARRSLLKRNNQHQQHQLAGDMQWWAIKVRARQAIKVLEVLDLERQRHRSHSHSTYQSSIDSCRKCSVSAWQ
eukprot:217383-Rhodomonas_salina.1